MANIGNEMDEYFKLMNEVDFNEMDMCDQLALFAALVEMMTKTKPILVKYAAKNPQITNFLFKL